MPEALPIPAPPALAVSVPPDRSAAARRTVLAIWACFALGLLLSLLLALRSIAGGDQLNLLARGWLLAARGLWISYGNPMSTGGKAPGGLTSLLVGLPLFLWWDFRAPGLLVVAFHAAAFLILDRSLRGILSARERLLFAVFYWLGPWRLYFSGFLWNPNYLFLFSAVHLATALAQRHRARFWASLLHVTALLFALQVHASALLLLTASALLWLRGYFKVHPAGAIAGGLIGSLPLLPWIRDVMAQPALITEAHKGFPGRGLLLVFPFLRGVVYWLRYGSLSLSGRMGRLDFTEALGPGADRLLRPLYFTLTQVIAPATIVLPLLAGVWLWRRQSRSAGHSTWRPDWRRLLRRLPDATSDRAWLHGYVLWTFLAALLIFAIAPTTFMYWQGLILIHAAVLPVVLWLGALLRTRRAPQVRAAAWTWATLAVVLGLGMAFGSPNYRCAGRHTMIFPLRHDSPMFRELGIQRVCPWPLQVPGGWWPDVLPAEKNAVYGDPLAATISDAKHSELEVRFITPWDRL